MAESRIEWTDRSDWNPIRGCTRVSPGCGGPGPHGGCYAEAIAARFSDPGQPFHGYAERTSKGGRWTGKVALQEDRLLLPLKWKKAARVFVSSTSDVFHESLSNEDIDRIFAVMALAPHLTFQVLTKRSARMREYMTNVYRAPGIITTILQVGKDLMIATATWPLPNVWLGVSVEDQQRADERIPDLLATPAAVRFLSCEPLIGPLVLPLACVHCAGTRWVDDQNWEPDYPTWETIERVQRAGLIPCGACNFAGWNEPVAAALPPLDWVIAGGESGPNARPMHPDWVRGLRDQCAAAGVPFHFKQWGEWAPYGHDLAFTALDPVETNTRARHICREGERPGPDNLVVRVGKKRAGRLLDGRTHDEFPAS